MIVNNMVSQVSKINSKDIHSKNKHINTKTKFSNILENEIGSTKLKFSKHANERLKSRDIYLDENDILKISEGVKSAKSKGVNESLMILKDVALIVNIKNKTVITALDSNESNVVTNIDGAVIL